MAILMVESRNGRKLHCVAMTVEGFGDAKVNKTWSLHLRSSGLVEREWNTWLAWWPQSSDGRRRQRLGSGSGTGLKDGGYVAVKASSAHFRSFL